MQVWGASTAKFVRTRTNFFAQDDRALRGIDSPRPTLFAKRRENGGAAGWLKAAVPRQAVEIPICCVGRIPGRAGGETCRYGVLLRSDVMKGEKACLQG